MVAQRHALTESEKCILVTALHVAAVQYQEDAKVCREGLNIALEHLFRKQAVDSLAWVDRIESAEAIVITEGA